MTPLWFWEDKFASPAWNKPSRGWKDEVTLNNFAHWVGTREPHQRYHWNSSARCVVCQWLNALGYEHVVIHDSFSMSIGGQYVRMGDHIFVADDLAYSGKYTFGALRKRLYKFLDEWGLQ